MTLSWQMKEKSNFGLDAAISRPQINAAFCCSPPSMHYPFEVLSEQMTLKGYGVHYVKLHCGIVDCGQVLGMTLCNWSHQHSTATFITPRELEKDAL